MLSSFLGQPIRQTRSIPPQVLKLYDKLHPKGTQASRTELTVIFLEVIKSFRRVYAFVDAIDEWSNEEQHGFDFTDSIINWQSEAANLSLFMTSRPKAPFLERLRHLMQTCSEIQITATNEDIQCYLKENLVEIHCLDGNDQKTQDDIVLKVVRASYDRFFLASLHCNSLKDAASRATLNKKLDRLQRGSDALNEAYDEVFGRIGAQSPGRGSLAASALLYIDAAFRLLRSKDIIVAVSIAPGDTAVDESKLVSVHQILSMCYGLVTYQEETDHVVFTYRTIADYLKSSQHGWLNEKRDCLGNACLTYLQMNDVKEPIRSQEDLLERIRTRPFLIYATLFAGFHVRYSDCQKLHERFENMLDDNACVDLISQINRRDSRAREHRLHVLVFFGLDKAMFKVLSGDSPLDKVQTFLRERGLVRWYDTDMDVEVEDRNGSTPLHNACAWGPTSCVQTLLEFRAIVNSKSGRHGTPLQAALQRGASPHPVLPIIRSIRTASPWDVPYGTIDTPPTTEIPPRAFNCDGMSLLLEQEEYKVRSFLGGEEYNAARAIPLDAMSDGTIRMLLDFNADVNAEAGFWGSPLNTAIASQHSDAVQVLLDAGADANKSAGIFGRPLQTAIFIANFGIARKLIEKEFAADKVSQFDTKRLDIMGVLYQTRGHQKRNGSLEEQMNIVELLLKNGADANDQDHLSKAALYTASREKYDDIDTYFKNLVDSNATQAQKQIILEATVLPNPDLAKVILEHFLGQGGDVNIRGEDGMTPLSRAANFGHVEVIRTLLAHGVNKELTDEKGNTPLITAANRGHAEILELLFDYGCDKEKANNNGENALIRASANGSKAMVSMIIDRGVDVNAKSNAGLAALSHCALHGCPDTAELLLSKGARIDVKTVVGNDALIIASKEGYVGMVQLLLSHDANVLQKSEAGNTALHKAVTERHDEIVQLLLGSSADVNQRNNEGETPLMQAVLQDHNETVQLLLERGAKVHDKNNKGETPLMQASMKGLVDIAEMLIKKGADVNGKDDSGSAPLALACFEGHDPIVRILIANGAQINLRGCDDDSPLRVAKRMGHWQIAKYLAAEGGVDAGRSLHSKFDAVKMSARKRVGLPA